MTKNNRDNNKSEYDHYFKRKKAACCFPGRYKLLVCFKKLNYIIRLTNNNNKRRNFDGLDKND